MHAPAKLGLITCLCTLFGRDLVRTRADSASVAFRVYGGHPNPQELNDRRLTLYEGSALSERDLVRTRAESASAVLLLADRFSPSVHHEDLSIQFQVGRALCIACLCSCWPSLGTFCV